jgi:hypothetical protein
MKNTVSVDYMGLVRALMQVKGATPATFVAVTEVKMNKTNNPYHGRVNKKQKSNVFINFDYAASVNRKLLKEGKDADFVAKPRKWGEKLPGTPIIFYQNKYYLEARFLNNEPKVEYIVDGVVTEKAVLETYLPVKNEDASKEHQGLDEVITIRDFLVNNIHELTVNGTHYVRNDI